VQLIIEVAWRTATPALPVDNVAAVANIAILIFGSLLVYAANGGDGGSDFLGRYLALGWVIGLRNAAGLILSIIAVGVVMELRSPGSTDATGAIEHASALLSVLYNALLYWRLAVHIRQVAFAGAAGTTPATTAAG
jgi:hypothetical protein